MNARVIYVNLACKLISCRCSIFFAVAIAKVEGSSYFNFIRMSHNASAKMANATILTSETTGKTFLTNATVLRL